MKKITQEEFSAFPVVDGIKQCQSGDYTATAATRRSHWLSTALFRRSVSVTDIDNLCHLVESLQSRCSELERANRELTNALREPPEERVTL